MRRERIILKGFALAHFAAEIALKVQCRALVSLLKHPGALCARDLVAIGLRRRSQLSRLRFKTYSLDVQVWTFVVRSAQMLGAHLHLDF